ncbi:SOS response-associated peptidase [Luteimonas sp. BDR2-5]|uniref:SOS response-associated peptidase n=1 Tax=Proluteimonas luteida TaxID=2878685 RepID=UPI001E395D72|nr:SOS response-associated peptidase [Luteimonas sp. BDR2-5]
MRRFVQAFADGAFGSALPGAVAAALLAAPPRYNIAVRKPAAVILDHGAGLQVEDLAWGLVPHWSKLPETPYTTVTVRLARAATSRIFRRPWETRRCVVPMSGYYKWDRSGARPHPWFVQARDGRALFAAGLWEQWEREAPALLSFAVLTHPNPAVPAPLVADGPVFLPEVQVAAWIQGPSAPLRFLSRMPQPALEAYPVSKRIRSRDVDDYTLLEPLDPADIDDGADPGPGPDDDEDD